MAVWTLFLYPLWSEASDQENGSCYVEWLMEYIHIENVAPFYLKKLTKQGYRVIFFRLLYWLSCPSEKRFKIWSYFNHPLELRRYPGSISGTDKQGFDSLIIAMKRIHKIHKNPGSISGADKQGFDSLIIAMKRIHKMWKDIISHIS